MDGCNLDTQFLIDKKAATLANKRLVLSILFKRSLIYLLILITIGVVFYCIKYAAQNQSIDYIAFASEAFITLMALSITCLILKQGKSHPVVNIFLIGFSCLYIALLIDSLDEIFVISSLATNIGESLMQVLAYILIFLGVFKWLQLNKITQKKLSRLSNTDALTGLLNRRSFIEKSNEEFERSIRYNRPLSLMMIDIDFFKLVNDQYGHLAGDVVLQKISVEIALQLRKNDIFCRWGGEEFILLIPESDKSNGQFLSEKIRRSIEKKPIELPSGETVDIKISIGCTSIRDNDNSVEALIERADRALYMSKEAGRNRVSFL